MSALARLSNRYFLITADLLAVSAANVLAVALRFDFDWNLLTTYGQRNLQLMVIDLIITPACFFIMGLYQGYWKYVGLDDLLRLLRAVGYRTIAIIVLFYTIGAHGLSRAVMIMATILLLIFAGTVRLAPRFSFEVQSTRRRSRGSRTIIIGAGDTGEALLRELRKDPQAGLNVVGFIDDDRRKHGMKIHGVPVVGDRSALQRHIEELGARDVVVALPSATGRSMQEFFEICRESGVQFRTVPTRGELERGAARIGQIRPVDLEDLLGRDPVSLDQAVLRENLSEHRLLVTGAAGSIGRELVRQAAAYEPAELLLIDRNENGLFHLDAELRNSYPLLKYRVVVCDIHDRNRLAMLFREFRPHCVLHAAAYKHVPLMEENPIEAIHNNVIAAHHLAQLASECNAERFIYVSTDKAVSPTSVMGATKQLGERLVKRVRGTTTRFMAVRFGNVLGSEGSVVPTFRQQIAAGGPVTVTDPEATRFFMTIPEASQLVLMAGSMGQGGETFLLRMGEPVRILDLARNLIELSGLEPDEGIKIVFTGLRPGEKLHERLQSERETTMPTTNKKIMILEGVEPLSEDEWSKFGTLEKAVREYDVGTALDILMTLVPDYTVSDTARRMASTITRQNIVGIASKKRFDAQPGEG